GVVVRTADGGSHRGRRAPGHLDRIGRQPARAAPPGPDALRHGWADRLGYAGGGRPALRVERGPARPVRGGHVPHRPLELQLHLGDPGPGLPHAVAVRPVERSGLTAYATLSAGCPRPGRGPVPRARPASVGSWSPAGIDTHR